MATEADFFVRIAKGVALDSDTYDQIERTAHNSARAYGGMYAEFIERTSGDDGAAYFNFVTRPARSDTPTPMPHEAGSPESKLRGGLSLWDRIGLPVEIV